jgi:hypothetical protein
MVAGAPGRIFTGMGGLLRESMAAGRNKPDPWHKGEREYRRCFDRLFSILKRNTRNLEKLASLNI